MAPLILPPEICSLICTSPLLSHSDLLALCHVSRSFRAEAERILYTSINLPTPSRRALNSWCTSLVRRPHLGARIHSLSLTMPSQTSLQADDLTRLTHALHLCINLRDLTILDGEPPFLGNAVHAWVLEGHTFALQKFTNTYFTTTMLRDFLEGQKSLTTLSHRPSSSTHLVLGTRFPRRETLPNLTTLNTSAAIIRELAKVASEPWKSIKRLQYFLENPKEEDELATFVALTSFGPLESLSIERWQEKTQVGMDVAIIAACAAAQMPTLKYLRIMDYTCLVRLFIPSSKLLINKSHLQQTGYQVSFLPFPMRFTRLRTLVIKPATVVNPLSDASSPTSAYPDLLQHVRRLEVAERIMNNLPTLELLILILPEKNYRFTRDEGAVWLVQNLIEVEVDDDAWMKVRLTDDLELKKDGDDLG
ncbi:uncharacterized protein LACBIDRAFT_322616 [Laccaria bicolor S238N-H82]|uniref:Predicted protein n=1 Tax=Laccaria bicolor (strain S238N-H82 / ATCC MYA-4686) TaxID=486041 RepID=B0CWY1_LACBS|nr:uncharacterized protein LACBIDRAFT_322616 [Laccaria bicolor S238N-H82]EDR13147.1 predicted protein [Laccaria bicolor S238N-H82]|eukprot:XP_001875645.1 predicted protein [Laccaria bicolor S238N-H82]